MAAAVRIDEDQDKVVRLMLAHLAGSAWAMRLEGPPGAGKTTIVANFLDRCRKSAMVTAPTNQATRVARRMASYIKNESVQFKTIYSAMCLRLSGDGEVKEIRDFSAMGARDPLEGVEVLIIDEASMLKDSIIARIEKKCVEMGIKVIFVLDRDQLKPVGQATLSRSALIEPSAVLTEVRRQVQGHPIIQLLGEIRRLLRVGYGWPEIVTKRSEHGGIYVVSHTAFCRQMRLAAASDSYATQDAYLQVLAWRNETVNAYNREAREAIYGAEALKNPFMVGERVSAIEPTVAIPNAAIEGTMFTDQEGVVQSVEVTYHPMFPERYKTYKLTILSDENDLCVAYVLHPDGYDAYSDRIKDLQSACRAGKEKWAVFWGFKEQFASIRPRHAGTVHKAQGSTISNVFLDAGDIRANRDGEEALRLLYVGVSRASKNLIVKLE